MIVDVVFVIVTAILVNGQINTRADTFQTRQECRDFEIKATEAVKEFKEGDGKEFPVFLGRCTAVTLEEIK